MPSQSSGPTTPRAKIVFFIWNNLPRFLFLTLIILIVILTGAINKKQSSIAADKEAAIKPERPPINAVTLALSPSTISDRINLPGNIEAWTSLSLLAKLNGTVDEILVREGQLVKKGDILARIDAEDYRIAMDRAKAAYDLAKSDYERDRAIYGKGIIPTAELDANQTKMQTALADYENAQLQFSRCAVTAPMNGIVRKLDAKVGLQLAVGDPLAEILEIDRIKAVIGIPESEVTAVRGLDQVTVRLQALGDREITAKIHYLSSSPETVARLFRLELAIDNPNGEILPGMFVRADIVKKTVPNALVVPFFSVISRNDEQYVFIEQNGTVTKRPVKIGIMEKWLVEISEGLKAGDKLLVEGHREVEEGQKVKIVKTATDLKDLTL